MAVKEITSEELLHIRNVLNYCEEEFRALEDDGAYVDTDGTYILIKEALEIVNPLLERKGRESVDPSEILEC